MWVLLAYIVVIWFIGTSLYDKYIAVKQNNENISSISRQVLDLKLQISELEGKVIHAYDFSVESRDKFEEVTKITNDVQKLITQTTLAQTFIPRNKRVNELKKPN